MIRVFIPSLRNLATRRLCERLLAIWMLLVTSAAPAQDRFVKRTPSGSRIGVGCSIHDYTGREIVFQAKAGGPIQRVPRRDVLDVSTNYVPPHTEARTLLEAGKAKEAFAKLEDALDQERRTWVRREILATQVKCALWDGDRITAGERFLAIVESDADTLYFPLMPLAWSEERPSEELIRAARNWMSPSMSAAAKLLGASHLLTDENEAVAAMKSLKELAREGHAEIQRLAQIQLWRARAISEEVSRDELFRWERTMEDAGDALGGGPRYILGLGWMKRHNDVAAAAAWLWLPLVSGEDRWLAARASWNAAQALERAGQDAEAAAVLAEIATRYADTPSAADAAKAEQGLKGIPPK